MTQHASGKLVTTVAAAIAAAFSVFQLWTSAYGALATLQQCYIHLGFALVLVFLLRPLSTRNATLLRFRWVLDLPCILLSIVVAGYITVNFLEITDRGGGDPSRLDILLGVAAVLLVLEGTRRMTGWAMPIVAIVFLAYAFAGPYLPAPFDHRGFDIERVASTLYVTASGIAGTPLQTSATYVAIFVIFAAFLEASGAGSFFIDWSYALLGWLRGGPAKVAIVASALMGTISGSAVANTAATGAFTIPIMKRTGLRPAFAGAVEAAASSGGQIMPPVMGAAAFIMVELLGIPYTSIMKAAIFPAILYFAAIYFMVDFEVAKMGIRGVSRSELPSAWKIFLGGWHLLIPLGLLIYLLVIIQYTPLKSAFFAVIATVLISYARTSTRMGPRRLWEGFYRGGQSLLEIAMACACAGIVVGVMLLTGLALRLSEILIDFSGGNLFVLMLLTMVISLILGMGLPTSAVYIILAILVAPAMMKLGVGALAAHMFIFYFGVLANVTPPVAIAAYTGAGIAGADPMLTGFIAARLALAGFLLPFMWVYNPSILLIGSPGSVAMAIVTALVGVIALASAVQGYLFGLIAPWYLRGLLLLGALGLIKPGILTDLAGFCLIGLAVGLRFTVFKHPAPIQAGRGEQRSAP